jgi:hypothetical protein
MDDSVGSRYDVDNRYISMFNRPLSILIQLYIAAESGEAYKLMLIVMKGGLPAGHMIKQHAHSLKTFALPLSLSSCSN